jgi:hypothetical protein
MYSFIYLFCFYFLFQFLRKRLHCKKTTQTVAAGRQQVQWASVCPGRPALPCPALVVTTDRQTPLLL